MDKQMKEHCFWSCYRSSTNRICWIQCPHRTLLSNQRLLEMQADDAAERNELAADSAAEREVSKQRQMPKPSSNNK
jgi:hypothetical protein